MFVFRFSLLFLITIAAGCTKISPPDDGYVSSVVGKRLDKQVEWRQGYCQDDRVRFIVQSLLEKEMSAEAVIQVALLNNPKIQATFEELGIAQADLVEAGLLSNPSFEIEVRYPNQGALKTNIEYLITSSFLDIFLIPLRTKVAATEFEQTKMRVANEILDLAFDVRQTFYELISERQKLIYIQSVAKLTEINRDLVTKQNEIGNVYKVDLQLAESRYLEAELEVAHSHAKIIQLTELLNRLLGLSEGNCLILPRTLPEDQYSDYDLCALESIALEERLDLQVARLEIIRFRQMLGLKQWWTYTNLKTGLAGEREPDGANVIGPGFSGELPIFNYGQATRSRLLSQLRQAQDRIAVLEIQVLSEVREAHNSLICYLKILNDYKERLLPLQSTIAASSEELYNVMGLGVDRLLEAKRVELITNQNYIENIKNYLVSRVKLDRALGGYLYRVMLQEPCAENQEICRKGIHQ